MWHKIPQALVDLAKALGLEVKTLRFGNDEQTRTWYVKLEDSARLIQGQE